MKLTIAIAFKHTTRDTVQRFVRGNGFETVEDMAAHVKMTAQQIAQERHANGKS